MKSKDKLFGFISHVISSITMRYLKWLPDKIYLSILFRVKVGKWINWKKTQTFNEKLQWLKLYNRKPVYTTMVDKDAVKEYVAGIIGSEYIIPTLGVWNTPEEIDSDTLPNKFVLKTTHGGGGGGIVICRDKATFDVEAAQRILNRSLKSDIYKYGREWPYKNVPRRIIAEKLLEIPDKTDLKDYKFFCFNGEPRFLKVDFDRFVDHHANYYDLDWNLLPFGEVVCPPDFLHTELRPDNFEQMIEISRTLSRGLPFLRVDLYNIAGHIYFGELTFFPASGLGKFMPREWDEKIGNYLQLPIGIAPKKS